MTTEPVFVGGPPERHVGQVYATIWVANGRDVFRAEEGLISFDEVRSIDLTHVLVDTGATTLSLPPELIEELGLRPWREVAVETAAGRTTSRLYRDVVLRIDARESSFDCLELPGGGVPLLGVVPLEMLGFEPDLKNQRLRKLPMDDSGSYLTIY
jgi:predicted aspartyl protease